MSYGMYMVASGGGAGGQIIAISSRHQHTLPTKADGVLEESDVFNMFQQFSGAKNG